MPCSAWLTSLLVADIHIKSGTGSFPMELEFPAVVSNGISTEPESRWWYVCTVEEMERRGSTTVRYLFQQILIRPYSLDCTQQTLVSYRIIVEFEYQAQVFVCIYMYVPFLTHMLGSYRSCYWDSWLVISYICVNTIAHSIPEAHCIRYTYPCIYKYA